MLVLSRRKGQRIIIRDDVVITLVSVHGKTVRLGIEAPLEVSVLRAELQNQPKGKPGSAPARGAR
jgi:carbon storage regulator